MEDMYIYNVNIKTSDSEIVNLKVQGSSEEDAQNNLNDAIQKEDKILAGAESYEIDSMNVDEDLTAQLREQAEKNNAKFEKIAEAIATYMKSLRELVQNDESEREKMKNGGFIFLMKKAEGQYMYAHCSKTTMEEFLANENIHVIPVSEFSAEDLDI